MPGFVTMVGMKMVIGMCLLWIAVESAWANGGGYIRGGLRQAGGIVGFEPVATERVRILDETLLIRAGRASAKVEVRYLMRNMTDKKVKVRFGFPIEESADDNPYRALGEAPATAHTSPRYCKEYEIKARGEVLKVRWQIEKNPEGDPRFNGLSGWNVSEITFAKGEEVPVTIRFVSQYPGSHHFVSDTSTSSAGIFRYRLSTAACWHGTIGEGRVVVEPDGIDPRDLRVIKPVNRFKKDGDRWIWNFKELEPTLAEDLEIECQPAVNVFDHQALAKERIGGLPSHLYAAYTERGGRWSMLHSNYEVRASSTLKPDGEIRYDAANIRDSREDKVWSEGVPDSGAGEWLEIHPVAAKPLIDIRIKPGFQSTEESRLHLFKANARPKRIRIDLNGEHRFEALLPDRAEEVVVPVSGYDKPVERLRMTFLEVYPGGRFEDLCITSVRLHARLDREPKIQPQR